MFIIVYIIAIILIIILLFIDMLILILLFIYITVSLWYVNKQKTLSAALISSRAKKPNLVEVYSLLKKIVFNFISFFFFLATRSGLCCLIWWIPLKQINASRRVKVFPYTRCQCYSIKWWTKTSTVLIRINHRFEFCFFHRNLENI